MSVTSFDLQNDFSERILKPEKLSERKGFDAKSDLSAMQAWQRLTFKAGLHICPHCAGHKLREMGYDYEGGQFLDASQRVRIDPSGLTDPFSHLGSVLKSVGLISDGKASKDLATNFHVTHRESKNAPNGKTAGYSHMPGQKCRSDDEHDLVIFLVKNRVRSELERVYPHCDVLVEEDRCTAIGSSRRPDLTFFVKGDQVDLSVAVEVQKSKIAFSSWMERNFNLASNYSSSLWIFRASGAAGRFNRILRESVVSGVNAWLYDVQGELGQRDSPVVLIPAAKDYPDYRRFDISLYGSSASREPDRAELCVRAERESEKKRKEMLSPLSSRSSFVLIEDGTSILVNPCATKLTNKAQSISDEVGFAKAQFCDSDLARPDDVLPFSACTSPDEPFQMSLFTFASRSASCHLWH